MWCAPTHTSSPTTKDISSHSIVRIYRSRYAQDFLSLSSEVFWYRQPTLKQCNTRRAVIAEKPRDASCCLEIFHQKFCWTYCTLQDLWAYYFAKYLKHTTRTKLGERAFSYADPAPWNALPASLQTPVITNKNAVLSQRRPRDAPYISLPWKFWRVDPEYAHAPLSPKFLTAFCSDWACECSGQIWSS